MIYTANKFKEQVALKEENLGHPLTIEEIAEGAEVKPIIVERIMGGQWALLTLGTVDRFLRYFELKEIGELVEYVVDKREEPREENHAYVVQQ